jgi:hypothetical protein
VLLVELLQLRVQLVHLEVPWEVVIADDVCLEVVLVLELVVDKAEEDLVLTVVD